MSTTSKAGNRRHWEVGKGKKAGVVGLGGRGHMTVKLARAFGGHVVFANCRIPPGTRPPKVERKFFELYDDGKHHPVEIIKK